MCRKCCLNARYHTFCSHPSKYLPKDFKQAYVSKKVGDIWRACTISQPVRRHKSKHTFFKIQYQKLKLYIKYMVSLRCKMLVKEELKKLGLQSQHVIVDLGVVEILEDIRKDQLVELKEKLLISGLELLDDSKSVLIEKVINVVMEMIHYSVENPVINYSNFISEKMHYDYTYLANIFSEVKGITLQQFIIIQKIERVKELLMFEELTLTKIANKLHYSSVAHLSNQFKKITGLTPTFFREVRHKRMVLENV